MTDCAPLLLPDLMSAYFIPDAVFTLHLNRSCFIDALLLPLCSSFDSSLPGETLSYEANCMHSLNKYEAHETTALCASKCYSIAEGQADRLEIWGGGLRKKSCTLNIVI